MRTRLGLAGGLIGGAGDGLLGLVESGLGGVGSLDAVSGVVRVSEEGKGNVRASLRPWCGNPCVRLRTCLRLFGGGLIC